MKKPILSSLILLCSMQHGLIYAQTSLSEVTRLFLAYEADQAIEKCEDNIKAALGAEGLVTVADQVSSDAVLKVKIAVNQGGMRPSLNWGAAILATDGTRLFSDAGEESGWSLKLACDDLASDLAEEIADDVKQARLIGF